MHPLNPLTGKRIVNQASPSLSYWLSKYTPGQVIKSKELKDMKRKWYQSRNIQAAFISGFFILIAAILTSPLWIGKSKNYSTNVTSNKNSTISLHSSPVSLQIIPNVSIGKMDSILVAMRSSEKLRELTPLETGKNISQTPSGTFFYISPIYLECTKGKLSESLQQGKVKRNGYREINFEVHYVSEGTIFLVAFVSSETVSGVSRLDGAVKKQVTLSPLPWDGIQTLVLVPLSRIVEAKRREIQTTDVGEISVLDVIVQ
jgi:hypothetical protein